MAIRYVNKRTLLTIFFYIAPYLSVFFGAHFFWDTLSGVTGGGGRGAECPPETSDREISIDLQEESGKEKIEKGEEKEEGKLKVEGGKVPK